MAEPESKLQRRADGTYFREEWRRSAIPFYAVGALWLLYALFFPLYRWFDFLIVIALSVGLFLLLDKVIPKKRVEVEVKYKPILTGHGDADEMLLEGHRLLGSIGQARRELPQEHPTTAQIVRIEEIVEKILKYITKNPQDAKQLRRFMNYYLPTTDKLVTSYRDLTRQDFDGGNVVDTCRNIEEMLGKIETAFRRQLDNLFEDDALDISTDIIVLEEMLKNGGLSGGEDFAAPKS